MQHKTDSPFYVIWHMIILAALGYSLVYASLDLVFHFELSLASVAIEFLLSSLFVADMVISAKYFFPRQFNPETGEKPYVKTPWFYIDFIGAIPFDVILFLSGGYFHASVFRLLRMSRMVRVGKAYRAIQEMRKSVFFLNLPNPIKLIMALGLVLFFAHVLACGWIMFNPMAETDNPFDHYVKSYYFITTTLTTIGYGDITPQTTYARLFTMCIQLMGVAIFGVVIGQISKLFLAQNKHEEAQREKMHDLVMLLNHYGVPTKVQKQVFSYHQHLNEKRLTENDGALIGDLPESLQDEIRLFMKLKLLHGMHLFDKLSEACLREVAISLKKKHFGPHDQIIKKGDIGHELFVVGHGSVNVLGPENKIIVTLRKGQFFGEKALLEDITRTADVEAASYCDLYTFDKEDFLRIIQSFPDLHERIHATVNRRYGDKATPAPQAPHSKSGNSNHKKAA